MCIFIAVNDYVHVYVVSVVMCMKFLKAYGVSVESTLECRERSIDLVILLGLH